MSLFRRKHQKFHIFTLSSNFNFQETQRLMQEPVPGISAVPDEQNARYFHVVVAGKLDDFTEKRRIS